MIKRQQLEEWLDLPVTKEFLEGLKEIEKYIEEEVGRKGSLFNLELNGQQLSVNEAYCHYQGKLDGVDLCDPERILYWAEKVGEEDE